MRRQTLSNLVLMIVVSFLLLFFGHSLVLHRTQIIGDTNAYISMIEGDFAGAPSPFKFRILVPFLAGLLPLSPTDSLRVISCASLFLCYLFILLTCRRLGLSTKHAVVGLLAVWGSTWHLYNYFNPYLTDSVGLLMICAMVYAVLSGRFVLFCLAALMGVLARETTIFLVPIWIVRRDWLRGVSVLLASMLVLLIPRYYLAAESDPTLIAAFQSIGILNQPLEFAKDTFLSWGFVWFLSLIGVWYLPNVRFALAAASYFSLLVGAVLTSFVATDTGRMFSILTPILALSCAQLYSELASRGRLLTLALISLIVIQALTSIPNIVFGAGSWAYGTPRIALLSVGIIYTAIVLIALRASLPKAVREKTAYLTETMRRPRTNAG